MTKIALLISDNLLPNAENTRPDRDELVEQMGKLIPAFASQGLELVEVRWREIEERAEEFAAILPLMVWDYFEGNEVAFLEAIDIAEKITPVFNPSDILKWNADKSYLDGLAACGASVIRTLTVERVTEANVAQAFEELDCETLVIKPQIGGGAWRQALYKKGDSFPDAESLPPDGALIQPFLSSVTDEGEYSFLYFGGTFSHAVRKTPKSGDYRIQSIYGGAEETYTPTEEEKDRAQTILETMDSMPLYARVDLLRGDDGTLKLIELECIEPYLYLPHAPGEGAANEGAQKLATALKSKLGI
jgi:glutathione synthase/RimK-type ligase-like ATP-grasp enzyme